MRQKKELLEIYDKAKAGKYDLKQLEIDELKMLNKLIKAEIEIKTKKLDEIVTDTNMKIYSIKHS